MTAIFIHMLRVFKCLWQAEENKGIYIPVRRHKGGKEEDSWTKAGEQMQYGAEYARAFLPLGQK